MVIWKGGDNKKRLGYPNIREGEISLKQWARYYKVSYGMLWYRIAIKGMNLDDAIKEIKAIK